MRRDITGEKGVQAELLAGRDRFERQFRGMPVPTFAWRLEGDDFVLASGQMGERLWLVAVTCESGNASQERGGHRWGAEHLPSRDAV